MICLSAARAQLSGRPHRLPCDACTAANADTLAQVRENAAKPSPLLKYEFGVTQTNATAHSLGGRVLPEVGVE